VMAGLLPGVTVAGLNVAR